MKILVINCGSSSLKYQLIDMTTEEVLVKGLVERISFDGSILTHQKPGMDKVIIKQDMKNHTEAVKLVLEALVNEKYGVVKSMDEISAVGHRVLHGAEAFKEPVIVNEEVIKTIRACIPLGPLHNPANLMGIEACRELMPKTPMVAIFDTAFHQTMPAENYMYAIPYEYYEKYQIRRYGFHGTSHRFVALAAAEMMGNPKKLNLVTCHLGNGSSVAAVKDGKCFDTSMGLTPLEGLVMGTRCGDMDPAIVPFIMNKENLTPDQMSDLMNKKSGVRGISGVSNDFRDVEAAEDKGDKRATLALDMFCSRVRKYIAAYAGTLGGIDGLVFTAGVGENSAALRKRICERLEFMGIEIDDQKNDIRGKSAFINKDGAKVKIMVIPTNEELMIAKDTMELVK